MKKSLILSTMFLCIALGTLSAQGIQFTGTSVAETQKLASQDGKLIFIDFYTDWCGPCKALSKTVFTLAEVGEYFNKNFYSCKVNAEKGDGVALAKKYDVRAFPTLLFINSAGDVVQRLVGSVGADKLLNAAQEAVTSLDDPNSYANIVKLYPEKKNDPDYLLRYIDAMTKASQRPVKDIETYLSLQKKIPESDVEMMEFLLDNAKSLMYGGNAERILKANMAEYMDIATNKEAATLEGLGSRMLQLTKMHAMATKDVPLFEIYLARWSEQPKENQIGTYTEHKLTLLSMQEDVPAYKKLATHYLDSMITSRSLAQIRHDDSVYYENYTPPRTMYAKFMKESARDLGAQLQRNAIVNIGDYFLKHAETKKEYKDLMRWSEYAETLLPDDNTATNFKSNVLYKQGKVKEALEIKTRLLNQLKPDDKKYPSIMKEIEVMKAGGKLD